MIKTQGLKGSQVLIDPRSQGSQGLKGLPTLSWGGYRTSRISVSTLVPRFEGLHERNISRVPKMPGASGFSRDRGLTLPGWGFQEVWCLQIQGFQGKNIYIYIYIF